MRFTPARCPKCGLDPDRIIESVFVMTGLQPPDANGDTDFESEQITKILWDSAEPDLINDEVTLFCAASHEWQAKMARPEEFEVEIQESHEGHFR